MSCMTESRGPAGIEVHDFGKLNPTPRQPNGLEIVHDPDISHENTKIVGVGSSGLLPLRGFVTSCDRFGGACG